jgi:hypothetical protein
MKMVEGIATIGAGLEKWISRTLGAVSSKMSEIFKENVARRGYEAEGHEWRWRVWGVWRWIDGCDLGV